MVRSPQEALAESLDAVFADTGAKKVGRTGAHALNASEVESFENLANVGRAEHQN